MQTASASASRRSRRHTRATARLSSASRTATSLPLSTALSSRSASNTRLSSYRGVRSAQSVFEGGMREAQIRLVRRGSVVRLRGAPADWSPPLDVTESIFPAAQLPNKPAQRGFPTALEVVAPYQHFNVLRKLPMSLGGRHARVIAIDGD